MIWLDCRAWGRANRQPKSRAMSVRHRAYGAIAISLAGIAGCKFDATVPEAAQISCGGNSDCPAGYLCAGGLCSKEIRPEAPVIDLKVMPSVARTGSPVTIDLGAKEPLTGLSKITLDLDVPIELPCPATDLLTCAPKESGIVACYRCTYTVTGAENRGQDGFIAFHTQVRDRAQNPFPVRGSIHLDFTAPGLGAANVAYLPDASNPLPTVDQAKANTVIQVTAVANEPLDPAFVPELVANLGQYRIDFVLISGSTAGAIFEAVVPANAPDGPYNPTLTWSDLAGNVSGVHFEVPPILVKTTQPTLSVDQTQVTYLRSPWGNAAGEDRRDQAGSFRIPAGPYFALAPADPLSGSPSLPLGTFSAGTSKTAAVRIWADSQKSILLGTMFPVLPGDAATAVFPPPSKKAAWPRVQLQNFDTPAVWATVLDDAGNESIPVKIVNVEWVATGNPPAFGVSPHSVDASVYLTETLLPSLDTSLGTQARLTGLGQPIQARAQPTFRQVVFGPSPLRRASHAMAYDCARGRVVLFGGVAPGGTSLGDTWEWDGSVWANRTPSAESPSPRSGHAMVYDAARSRVVLYGGTDAASFRPTDTWEWDGSNWSEVAQAGARPGGRDRPGMAFDGIHGKVILFGGAGSNADTWAWNGSSWTQIASGGLSGRDNLAMAFDAARGVVVLYGGSVSPNPALDDLWEFDGTAWTQPPHGLAVPGARDGHSLVYDGQSVILFGGALQDATTWKWNGATWTALPSSPFGGRDRHAAAYDAAAGRMLVFGGQQDAMGSKARFDNTWDWDGASWRDRTPPRTAQEVPLSTTGARLAFDEMSKKAVLFGGATPSGSFPADLWGWDGARWSNVMQAGPSSPPGRGFHAMANDGKRVVMFGGKDANGLVPGVWEWDGAAKSWTLRTPIGGPPPGRTRAGLAFDTFRSVLVLFGGDGAFPGFPLTSSPRNDTWELTAPLSGTWSWAPMASPPAALTPRFGHSLLFDGTRTLAFFGASSSSGPFSSEVWQWNGASWTPLAISGSIPAGRAGQGMIWDGTRKRGVSFGGLSQQGALGELWEWTGTGFEQRTRPPQANWPSARSDPAMAFDSVRGRAVLLGGFVSGSVLNDLWEWDADTKRTPMVQLTVSYAGAGFTDPSVTGLRVRARAGGSFGAAGKGVELYGWRTGGTGILPGQWSPLSAKNTEGLPLAPAASFLSWTTPASDLASFFVSRDAVLSFQLRPAGPSTPIDPEPALEANYLEVRVRYAAP
jgi:hypothetical protein